MAGAGAATVEKALDVLFHLHDADMALGLSQIGRDLDLPKSSCHRLLATLVNRELVERDDSGRYRPGLALLSLGIGAQNREPVVHAARPILEEESITFGETVFLVGRRRNQLRVLDKFEGSGFLRAAPGIGDVVPRDVTAVGKLYHVFGEATRMEDNLGNPVDAQDASAPDPADETENAEAQVIRRRGYAVNRDAWIDGLSVLGVPIWQPAGPAPGRMIACLALAAASARFDVLGEEDVANRLLAAAASVTERLSGRPLSARRKG
jgi:DNA-binding IclR family transcriptional regulator